MTFGIYASALSWSILKQRPLPIIPGSGEKIVGITASFDIVAVVALVVLAILTMTGTLPFSPGASRAFFTAGAVIVGFDLLSYCALKVSATYNESKNN